MAEGDLIGIYQALLAGRPTAPRDLVNACSARLYVLLKHRDSLLSPETVQDAVHDALLALIQQPERYRSERGGLLNYLVHIGANKLNDQIRACGRRRREMAVGGAVELAEVEANAYEGDGARAWEAPTGAELPLAG